MLAIGRYLDLVLLPPAITPSALASDSGVERVYLDYPRKSRRSHTYGQVGINMGLTSYYAGGISLRDIPCPYIGCELTGCAAPFATEENQVLGFQGDNIANPIIIVMLSTKNWKNHPYSGFPQSPRSLAQRVNFIPSNSSPQILQYTTRERYLGVITASGTP